MTKQIDVPVEQKRKDCYIFVVDIFNAKYAKLISPAFKGHQTFIFHNNISVFAELNSFLKKVESAKHVTVKGIILSHTPLLKKLIAENFEAASAKLGTSEAISTNYQGALFHKEIGGKDYPIVILPELKAIVFKPYSIFLCKRYVSKLWNTKFPTAPEMTWDIVNENNVEDLYQLFKGAIIIGGDIETVPEEIPHWITELPDMEGIWLNTAKRDKDGKKTKERVNVVPKITLQGYTGIFKDENGIMRSHTIVFRMNSMDNVNWMRKFNKLPAIKIYQNGKYDISYHLRYGAPMENFLYDTYGMFHSWYAELPRKLGFISSFFLKNHMYWKDEMGIDSAYYNAQDCHYMTWSCLFMMQEMPDWAKKNYIENFPKIFPSVQCNLHGVLIDPVEESKLREQEEIKLTKAKRRMEVITDTQNFNAGSSPQVVTLMKLLGFQTKKSDKAAQVAFRDKSDFNLIFAEAIEDVRKARKALSNYFTIDLFNGMLLYSLDPFGTDSGRFACRESDFWCGTQIQNIPFYAKGMIIPFKGWKFGAADYAQSESRSTAYISEDENLLDAVENSEDFHVKNASMFFGIPEEHFWHWKKHDPAMYKKYRNEIGKKINHGANYNMGPNVLLQNMGAKAVIAAAHALHLDSSLTLIQVCEVLLGFFDKTYPMIRDLTNPKTMYSRMVKEISETSMMVGATGWTRYCFDHPMRNKPSLNKYAAHGPQSLSAKITNQAFFDCWKKLQIEENLIRMLAQVHDEVWFMYREEHKEYIFDTISKIMRKPTKVNGRVMIIPDDQARGANTWAECK